MTVDDLLSAQVPASGADIDAEGYDRPGARWLERRISDGVLLVQGPMGSQLMSQVGAHDVPAAFWNVGEPQEVARLHALYRACGADAMLTNTFQASAPALARDGVTAPMRRVNREAVALARRAGAPCTLGSIGMCGIDWLVEDSAEYRAARAAYRDQARELLAAGVSGIMLETFTSTRALAPALEGALDAADGMPVLASFAIDDAGDLLGDGLNIEAACMFAQERGACSVGVNCCSVEAATAAVPRMVRAVPLPVSVRPNAGYPERADDGAPVWREQPEAFAAACPRWVADGARIVGSCCGAGPLTTCALSGVLAG